MAGTRSQRHLREIQGVDSSGNGPNNNQRRYVYTYNAIDSSATFVPWVPPINIFSYGADIVVTTANLGRNQNIIAGEGDTGVHRLALSNAGQVTIFYNEPDGTGRSGVGSTTLTDGQAVSIEVVATSGNISIFLDGVLDKSVDFEPEIPALTHLATRTDAGANFNFGGTITNVFFTPPSFGPEIVDENGYTAVKSVVTQDNGLITVDDSGNAGGDSAARQQLTATVSGELYFLSFDFVSSTTFGQVSMYGLEGYSNNETTPFDNLTVPGTYTLVYEGDSEKNYLWLVTAGTGITVYDNVTVRKVIAPQDLEYPEYLPYAGRLYEGLPTSKGTTNIIRDVLNTPRIKYHLDGISYFTIPTENLVLGDVVTLKVVLPATLPVDDVFFADALIANEFKAYASSTGAYSSEGISATLVDGEAIDSGDILPFDGLEHTFTFTAAGPAGLQYFGVNNLLTKASNFPIYDISIEGKRAFAVDEGYGPVLIDSVAGQNGTIVNSNNANWLSSSPTDAEIQNYNSMDWGVVV
tara:strand:- start:452 stop:2020 length:1569 start_codon:yes stop_codon:yes gene_type:complete